MLPQVLHVRLSTQSQVQQLRSLPAGDEGGARGERDSGHPCRSSQRRPAAAPSLACFWASASSWDLASSSALSCSGDSCLSSAAAPSCEGPAAASPSPGGGGGASFAARASGLDEENQDLRLWEAAVVDRRADSACGKGAGRSAAAAAAAAGARAAGGLTPVVMDWHDASTCTSWDCCCAARASSRNAEHRISATISVPRPEREPCICGVGRGISGRLEVNRGAFGRLSDGERCPLPSRKSSWLVAGSRGAQEARQGAICRIPSNLSTQDSRRTLLPWRYGRILVCFAHRRQLIL